MTRALTVRLLARSAAVVSWLIASCAAPPPESERLEDTIILTKYASDVNFGSFRTFYLRPEILAYNDGGDPEPIDEDTARPLLDATEKNLESRGYTATTDSAQADLGVQVMYTDHVNTSYWCYYWWDPYYWGYPGWGYYPYYGACDYTVWKSGMLGTVIVDLTKAVIDPGTGEAGAGGASGTLDQVPGIWFSGVYGTSLTSQEARDGINQAFKQSPYLRAD